MKKFILVLLILVASIPIGYKIATGKYSEKQPVNFIQSIRMSQTKEGLLSYKQSIEIKLDMIEKEAPEMEVYFVTITFSQYLNEFELEDLVKRYNLKVHAIVGRTIEKDTGLKGTFLIGIEDMKIEYDKKDLENMLSRNDAVFKGFIELIADVSKRDLCLLKNDERVFLVDVSADSHFVLNPKHEKTKSWDGYMQGIFDGLEKFGLVKP